jgi:hypothetical protein
VATNRRTTFSALMGPARLQLVRFGNPTKTTPHPDNVQSPILGKIAKAREGPSVGLAVTEACPPACKPGARPIPPT